MKPHNLVDSMQTDNHLQLIRQAQQGDRDAFAQLVDEHYDTLYRFAYRWAGNQADAEDIAQLACIKLARSLCQFSFRSAFTSWLYRLVINCAKDWHKSQRRHSPARDFTPQMDSVVHHGGEHERYLQQLLLRIERMGEGFRETALLVHGEGFSHKEAADVLAVKESTVSWRLHEIRKRLASEEGRLSI